MIHPANTGYWNYSITYIYMSIYLRRFCCDNDGNGDDNDGNGDLQCV